MRNVARSGLLVPPRGPGWAKAFSVPPDLGEALWTQRPSFPAQRRRRCDVAFSCCGLSAALSNQAELGDDLLAVQTDLARE